VLLLLDRQLKGPITNILALSQTIASGRISRLSVREYARMAGFEAARLKRLVEEMAVIFHLDRTDVVPAATRRRGKKRSPSAPRHNSRPQR